MSQRSWYSSSCKKKTQMVLNSSSVQMSRTEQPMAYWILSYSQCLVHSAMSCTLSICSSYPPVSLLLHPLPGSLCTVQTSSWCALIFCLFQHWGRWEHQRLKAKLSFIFRGQTPDILLISLSSGRMKHALIGWDTALIFARDCTIAPRQAQGDPGFFFGGPLFCLWVL